MEDLLGYLQFVLAPQVVTGLVIGIAVILMALGLTIIFGLLDVINMAHGAFYALGAFQLVALMGAGVSFWVCLVLVPLMVIPVVDLGRLLPARSVGVLDRRSVHGPAGHGQPALLFHLRTLRLRRAAACLAFRSKTRVEHDVERLGYHARSCRRRA
jgi:hypothetical protein